MKKQLLCAAALLSFTGAAAYADEVSDLKAEAKALAKQNEQLNKRLSDIEKRQKVLDARAADLSMPVKAVKAPPVIDDALCWHGVCLYGVIDGGFGWESHGMPFNGSFPTGAAYLVQKGSNRAMFEASPNGLSQSTIGLKGSTELLPGINGIFKVETGFDPFSGGLANGQGSMVQNNNIPLAVQSTNGDSSRNGQALNGQAWVGLQSPVYGTLTIGRNNALTLDQILAYDPMGGSYAFSPLGWSGLFAGGGSTEIARLDQSLKYTWNYGPVHAGVAYQVGNYGNSGNSQWVHDDLQGDIGFNYLGFSVDGTAMKARGVINASLPSTTPASPPLTTLKASMSDNTSWMVTGKYKWTGFEVMGGYEHIDFTDPSNPVSPGFADNAGYTFSAVSNVDYITGDKIIQMMWVGGKWQATDHLNLSLAYYHEIQNSYGNNTITGAGALGCTTAAYKTCSGTMDVVSFVADYVFTKHFDVYAGVMYSQINGGLANGAVQTSFINSVGNIDTTRSTNGIAGWNGKNSANNISPMAGARYSF